MPKTLSNLRQDTLRLHTCGEVPAHWMKTISQIGLSRLYLSKISWMSESDECTDPVRFPDELDEETIKNFQTLTWVSGDIPSPDWIDQLEKL